MIMTIRRERSQMDVPAGTRKPEDRRRARRRLEEARNNEQILKKGARIGAGIKRVLAFLVLR